MSLKNLFLSLKTYLLFYFIKRNVLFFQVLKLRQFSGSFHGQDHDDERSRGFERRANIQARQSIFDRFFSRTVPRTANSGERRRPNRPAFTEPPLDRLALALPTQSSSKTFLNCTKASKPTDQGVAINFEDDGHLVIPQQRPQANLPLAQVDPPPQPQPLLQRDVLQEAILAWNEPDPLGQPEDDIDYPNFDEQLEDVNIDDNVSVGEASDSGTDYYSPPPSPGPGFGLRISPRKNKGLPPLRFGNPVYF